MKIEQLLSQLRLILTRYKLLSQTQTNINATRRSFWDRLAYR